MDYEQLRRTEWSELIETRYDHWIQGLPLGEARDAFVDRLYDAFEEGHNDELPLSFEEDCSDRVGVIQEVLASLLPSERSFLRRHPEHLGLRCEAYSLGIPLEQLIASQLSNSQRARLSELALDALMPAFPVMRSA